jgi:Tol biopolymer transport system component
MANRRAYQRAGCIALTTAFSLFGTTGSAHARIVKPNVKAQPEESCAQAGCSHLESTIVFTNAHDPSGSGSMTRPAAVAAAQIYLMNPDPENPNPRPLTKNQDGANAFANLSPDGTRIVFERLTTDNCEDPAAPTGERKASNISDLYVMNADGSNQRRLTRGSSATWSPDGKDIAFHASAKYYGHDPGVYGDCPINTNPGAATLDSDIFVANVDDLLARTAQPVDITRTPLLSEDDADWSPSPTTAPDGQSIAFTAHLPTDPRNNFPDAKIHIINPDGSNPKVLRDNNTDGQVATPAWSPDGTRILHECRVGGDLTDFQICVMNADGTNLEQLTSDFSVQNLSPTWSPNGKKIVFDKLLPPLPPPTIDPSSEVLNYQLFTMNSTLKPNGNMPDAEELTCAQEQATPQTPPYPYPCPPGVTPTPGINLLAHWGVLHVQG